MMNYLIGVVFGFLCLLPFLKSSNRVLAMNGYLALVIMFSIYLGAWLVTGSFSKIIFETFIAMGLLAVATLFRSKWPLGIAILVFMHGLYDHLLGHKTGVAEWYPQICAGFDVIVGIGLAILILSNEKREQVEQI